MRQWLFWGALISLFGLSEEHLLQALPKMDVSSVDAQFNGKEAVLVGEVSIRHRLGEITAHRIAMTPIKDEKSGKRAPLFSISEDVEIQFNGGGALQCQLAEIDYAQMKGHFRGDPSHPDVTFKFKQDSANAQEKGEMTPFVLTSREMNVELAKEVSEGDSQSGVVIKAFYASDDVAAHYQGRYSLYADTAHFERSPIPTKSPKESPIEGILCLRGENGCKLSTADGGEIISQEVYVDTKREILTLIHPRGTLKQHHLELSFVANQFVWDHQANSFQLMGDVHVTHNRGIVLRTPAEISYRQGELNQNMITAERDTDIAFCSPKNQVQHKIHCPGPMSLDSLKCHLALNGDGERQVVVENIFGEASANKIDVYYKNNEGQNEPDDGMKRSRLPFFAKTAVPEQLLLQGSVRLINRFNGHQEEVGGTLHYALADLLLYRPAIEEMLLECYEGNRVLFYDEVNKMQMSAPSLVIKRDQESHKEKVQGIGDVRFNFAEQELARLKQYFKIEDNKK